MQYLKWGVSGFAVVLISDIAQGIAVSNGMSPTIVKIAKYGAGGVLLAVAHKWLIPKAA